ncbi:MAG: hypothetical protein IKO37_00945 [Prevotella sp.]|nr:hypothetical protein [Prevotella sp.]
MIGLFDNDPVFKGKKRDSKGRFATAERAMYDKATKENSWLRLQVEKYKRIADVSGGAFIAQQRIIVTQSRVIADLRKELAKLKKLTKC